MRGLLLSHCLLDQILFSIYQFITLGHCHGQLLEELLFKDIVGFIFALTFSIFSIFLKYMLKTSFAPNHNFCSGQRSWCVNLTRWSRVLRDTAASQLHDISRSAGTFVRLGSGQSNWCGLSVFGLLL